MNKEKIIKLTSTVLIVCMICTSCKLFPTQKMIDNIIPDYNIRTYTIADLLPYSLKEIRSAQALYGMELTNYFVKNVSTESESKRITNEEKNSFYREIACMNHNYKIINERYKMYLQDDIHSEEYNIGERKKEYDGYYALKNADSENVIKEYNNGKASGMPKMSIRAIMSTATESDVTDMYTEVMCEIYRPVTIFNNVYEALKIGDVLTLEVPATNSTVNCTEIIRKQVMYVATDSFVNTDKSVEKEYFFIAPADGISNVRRIVDYYGKTLETYVETKPLQFMKYTRVAEANDITRLLFAVTFENLEHYDFDKIVEKALCGGYLTYKYKDFVYANAITTNLKGYITSLTDYTNQRIDNEFYRTISE